MLYLQGAPSLYGVLNFLSGPHWSPRTPAERVLKYHWTVLEHSVCEVRVCHLCMLALLCQKAQLLKYHHLRNFHMSDKCQEFLWFYSLLMPRNPDPETSSFLRAGGHQCLSRLSKLSMLSLQPSSPCHIRMLLTPSCHSQGLECSVPWSSSSSEWGLPAEAQVT